MKFTRILFSAIAALSTAASAINVGDPAPLFSHETYSGGTFDLARQRGKVTVLLFL
jgi:hypothetical protein